MLSDTTIENAKELLKEYNQRGRASEDWEWKAGECLNDFRQADNYDTLLTEEECEEYIKHQLETGAGLNVLKNELADYDYNATWHEIDGYGFLRAVYSSDIKEQLEEAVEYYENEN